ncbi:MAG: pseudouridine synthase [Saprospiraceae bacterium]
MAKTNKQAHRIKSVKPNTRLTDYAAQIFPILGSRTAAKKAIAAGTLLVNDELSEEGAFVKKGDVLILKIKAVKKPKVHIDLPVVFEDDYLIVINKPAGIAVNGNRNKTVENAIISIAKKSYQADALPSPVAVHRIDVPTKGLVLLAKTKSALIKLSKAFQNNQVKKTYWAIVHGQTAPKGRIDQALQGKSAITDFETIKVVPSRIFKHLSLVKLSPVTGRTHQLRIHLNDARHLIVGDKQYAGRTRTILGKGLFLAACQLIFTHPISGKTMDLGIEPPARFKKFLEREGKRF